MTRREKPITALLDEAGWTMVRSRTHMIFRCPCGSHQTAVAKTPGEKRGLKNKLAELKRTGCPSLEGKI